jgi:predicted MPP superfamily phosphohydrolase
MIVAVLHLSDIHFKCDRANPARARIPQIAGAVRASNMLIDHCIVVISGDVAFSGQKSQYDEAIAFVRDLKAELTKHYGDVFFAVVPGNHDCNYDTKSEVREILIKEIRGNNEPTFASGIVAELLRPQAEFFHFWAESSGGGSSDSCWLTKRHEIDLEKHQVRINLLNTALLSSLEEERGGLKFPIDVAEETLALHDGADLVLTVFHHPYPWFETTNANKFRGVVESSSDLVLTGHEHVVSVYQKQVITGENLTYLEGAVLHSEDAPDSGFNVVLFDLQRKTQKAIAFRWAGASFEPLVERKWAPFTRSASFGRTFRNAPDFEHYLEAAGTGFTHPRRPVLKLDDIYVYPDLRKISLTPEITHAPEMQIVASEDVTGYIHSCKALLVSGTDHAGKSAMARKLYRDLQSQSIVPILLRGRDAKFLDDDAFSRAIEQAFKEQYDQASLEAFKQLPPDSKALIFDDWHHARFGARQQKRTAETARRVFGRVVVLVGDLVRVEEIARSEKDSEPFLGFERCEIRPLSHVLRGRLIEKWLTLGRDVHPDDPALVREIQRVEKVIRTLLGKQLLPSYPLWILIILQNFESGRGASSPAGSIGYLYEHLITEALARAVTDVVRLDILYVVLSRLSFHLFEKQTKHFARSDVQEVVTRYFEESDIKLDVSEVINALLCADLIFQVDGN